MVTYPIYSKDGRLLAFEIENAYIGLRKIVDVLTRISGVSNVKRRRLFGYPSDIHIEFHYLDKAFIVLEPYGDSSRYWIGPKETEEICINLGEIENIFKLYKPPFLVKLLGDLVMLRFPSLFRQKQREGGVRSSHKP